METKKDQNEETDLFQIICKTCQNHLLYSEFQVSFSQSFPEFEIFRCT